MKKQYPHTMTARRDMPEAEKLAAICVTCEFFHIHPNPEIGARCTHKRCGCNGPENGHAAIELYGVTFSPSLVNLLRRRKECPDGRW